ncbi:hypothetical protein [Desulfosporosinus sp. FKA]|uniref:hypothetical protein n=1 Tax=Desulfosporosinus sp. FKA TaxID=1969834 RepID=UPI000B4A448F|nr:hypothetical protein [Desulfosporosinus sp. FKA]
MFTNLILKTDDPKLLPNTSVNLEGDIFKNLAVRPDSFQVGNSNSSTILNWNLPFRVTPSSAQDKETMLANFNDYLAHATYLSLLKDSSLEFCLNPSAISNCTGESQYNKVLGIEHLSRPVDFSKIEEVHQSAGETLGILDIRRPIDKITQQQVLLQNDLCSKNNVLPKDTSILEEFLDDIRYWAFPIYKLSFLFFSYRGRELEDIPSAEFADTIRQFYSELQNVILPPTQVFVWGNRLEACWEFPTPIIPNSDEDTINLILNFLQFIHYLNLGTGKLNGGMFYDDPQHLNRADYLFTCILGLSNKIKLVDCNSFKTIEPATDNTVDLYDFAHLL